MPHTAFTSGPRSSFAVAPLLTPSGAGALSSACSARPVASGDWLAVARTLARALALARCAVGGASSYRYRAGDPDCCRVRGRPRSYRQCAGGANARVHRAPRDLRQARSPHPHARRRRTLHRDLHAESSRLLPDPPLPHPVQRRALRRGELPPRDRTGGGLRRGRLHLRHPGRAGALPLRRHLHAHDAAQGRQEGTARRRREHRYLRHHRVVAAATSPATTGASGSGGSPTAASSRRRG